MTADLSALSGEALRKEERRVDRLLGSEIDRLKLSDPTFGAVLDRSLAIEDEIARRKNR